MPFLVDIDSFNRKPEACATAPSKNLLESSTDADKMQVFRLLAAE